MLGSAPLAKAPLAGTSKPVSANGALAVTNGPSVLSAAATAIAGAALAPVVLNPGAALGSAPLGGSTPQASGTILTASATRAPPTGSLYAVNGPSVLTASATVQVSAGGAITNGATILAARAAAVVSGRLSATSGPSVTGLGATSNVRVAAASIVSGPTILTASGSTAITPAKIGRSTAQYLGLITPEHTGQPKFAATVALSVDPLARLQVALRKLAVIDFNLDEAVGPQLDAVGIRVGRSRFVPYPLQGLFFSFDDPVRGLDQGIWKGPLDVGSSLYRLDDDTYRRLLRAKILANIWDGTIEGEEAIYRAYFTDPATLVFVSDDAITAQPEQFFSFDDPVRGLDESAWMPPGGGEQTPTPASIDMAMTVGFAGKIPSVVDLAILNEGLIGAKPEGVAVNYAVTSIDGAPLFGLDMDGAYIAGFDRGTWGVTPADLIGEPV